ncbi:MAG TPA: ATP-binding cassette domain-containing protein [Burkholderiales bacterium]|nr:ATP-binding cassette domain-containing protein [Burkholderiales bacterium]
MTAVPAHVPPDGARRNPPDTAATARPPVLEVDGIVTRFGRNTIHDGVSFTVARGQVVAIIGGSGTGKSVLLREIIGLLRPTAGTVRLLGTDVWAASPEALARLRARFGMMFQDGALFSSLSVADNVATPLKEHARLPPGLLDPLVRLRIAMAGLPPDAAGKMPSELSGGMRKRAAIARALALEPEVLLLDEPTSGLDPITARAFDGLLRVLCDDLGLTVIVVTHDLDTLLGIVDRVIVLARGKVLADAPVREVMAVDDGWVQSYFSVRRMINEEGEVEDGG